MVDVDAQLAAVRRDLHTEGGDGGARRLQRVAQEYAADLDDVWEAITTPERVRRWFLPLTGDLRVGGRYQLEGNAGGTVLECSPPDGESATLRVTWAYGDAADTWVTVRLRDLGGRGTGLELEHEARVDDIPDDLWTQFGPSATGIGWDSILLGLALHVTRDPHGVTPEEAAAWMVSEEGIRFARGSAAAWAAAHIADGADPEAASRAADATAALYTQPPTEG